MTTFMFAVLALVLHASLCASYPYNDESRLLSDLLKHYDPRVRPVKTHENAVTVQLGIGLTDIIEEDKSSFDIQGWLKMVWTDYNLQWDPVKYNGIKEVKVIPFVQDHTPLIWLPDITAYKGQVLPLDSTSPARAVIGSDGRVTWIPQRSFKVPCEQKSDKNLNCELKLGSWVYNVLELNIQDFGNQTIDNFVLPKSASKWNLSGVDFDRKQSVFPCCPEPYAFYNFTFSFSSK